MQRRQGTAAFYMFESLGKKCFCLVTSYHVIPTSDVDEICRAEFLMECPYEASIVAQKVTCQQDPQSQELFFKFITTWIDHVSAFEELDTTIIELTPECITSLSLDVTNFLVVRAPRVSDEVSEQCLTC